MFVYMNVAEIAGVGAEPRPDWIWLEDCTFAFERRETSTNTADKPAKPVVRAVARPLSIVKYSDRATPSLVAWMASGKKRQVKIEYSLITELPLVEFTLTGARMTSYKATFEDYGKTKTVMERLSIIYDEISLDYWQQSQFNEDAGGKSSFALPIDG